MKSRLSNLAECGIAPFAFAGFAFPKHVWTLPRGSFAKRIKDHANACAGDYYHAPKPNNANGMGFYLDSDGMPALRWKRADDVASLRHTGWCCDSYGNQTVFGVVFRLPNNRGFLAGWSMGEGMASSLDYNIYPDEESAAYAADSMAEQVAEDEREYQDEQEGE